MRPPPKPPANGYAYTNPRKSLTDDVEKPNITFEDSKKVQKTSTTSTYGFSPPQNPFFEASFYTQRPPPSALITVFDFNGIYNHRSTMINCSRSSNSYDFINHYILYYRNRRWKRLQLRHFRKLWDFFIYQVSQSNLDFDKPR